MIPTGNPAVKQGTAYGGGDADRFTFRIYAAYVNYGGDVVVPSPGRAVIGSNVLSLEEDTGAINLLRQRLVIDGYTEPDRVIEVYSSKVTLDESLVVVPNSYELEDSGWAGVSVESRGLKKYTHLAYYVRAIGEYRMPLRYLAGTEGRKIEDEIYAMTSVSQDCVMFSTRDNASKTFIRNPNFWGSSFGGFPFVSVHNSRFGNKNCATLITPQAVITSLHYPLQINDKVYFVDANNNMLERTLVGRRANTPGQTPPEYGADLVVYKLNEPLPSTVKPVSFMPSDYRNYLPKSDMKFGVEYEGSPYTVFDDFLPTICTCQDKMAFVHRLVNNHESLHYSDSMRVSSDLLFVPVSSNMLYRFKGGDSSHPAFTIVNGEPVLMYIYTGADTKWGGSRTGGSDMMYLSDGLDNYYLPALGLTEKTNRVSFT